MEKILVVEDSPEFQISIGMVLGEHYDVTYASTGSSARQHLQNSFDLIILDVTLPDTNGFSLFRLARSSGWLGATPVMFLTGRDSMEDRVMGLRLGAEDYLLKPFEPLEFVARVENRIKKAKSLRNENEVIQRGPFQFNLPAQRVSLTVDHSTLALSLTPIEFRLLVHLASHPDHVISRARLVEIASGSGIHVLERTIDKHICSLRRKIEPFGRAVVTVFGEGYRFFLSEVGNRIAKTS